jgi:hypothetical protein
MALVRLVLHRVSCSNETVRDIPKPEFWVQWSGSGAFVAKNSDTTFVTARKSMQNLPSYAITAQLAETPQNMSFGSNGVDQVRSLRKKPTQLHLANLDATSFSELVR